MEDTKKVLFKRATATNALREVEKRLEDYNKGQADKEYPIDITEVILFGSYAKGAEQVHDLDIFMSVKEHREKYADFCDQYDIYYRDMLEMIVKVLNELGKYIKGRKRIISLHVDAYSGKEERDLAISDTHYFIMKDGKLNYDVIEELLAS